MIRLSIIIPAYNESQRLPATLDRLLAYLGQNGPSPWEIVAVDDGSSDDTAGVIVHYSRRNPSIRLVRNPGNRGKGYAVRNGMLNAQGEWLLFTDADLSTPIEEFPKLLDAAQRSGSAIAIGSRALDRSLVKVHQSAAREISGRAFNLLLRGLVGLPFLDTQCGFKLFRADAARQIFPLQRMDGFSFDVEDLVIAQSLGFRAVEVPVVWKNAEGTKVTLRQGLQSFADLVTIRGNKARGLYSSVHEHISSTVSQ